MRPGGRRERHEAAYICCSGGGTGPHSVRLRRGSAGPHGRAVHRPLLHPVRIPKRKRGQTSGGKILIVYFTADENREVDAVTSASLTTVDGVEKGRVRAVADMIQAGTGGELFAIQTETGYPSDGGALIDYAAQEQEQNARPALTTHIENLADYDTIFVGYPNWWYDMPMALYSFFDEYDLSGKTVIPFNVHNGSRFSSTIQTIQELEPGANVVTDGFTVSERNVAEAAADVDEWLNGLGF